MTSMLCEGPVSSKKDFFESANWWRATTLTERMASLRSVRGKPLKGAVDADLAARRMKRWRSQRPFSAGAYFAQRLATDRVSEEDFLCCLGEPVEVLQSRLSDSPGWLESLYRLCSRPAYSNPLPLPEALSTHQTVGFLNLTEPLLHEALERVREGAEKLALSSGQLPFDLRTVAAQLFANLPKQLLVMLGRTMVLELHVARLEGRLEGKTTEERFRSFVERLRQRNVSFALLEEYPVLARQLVARIDNWVNVSLEFLQRLTSDWRLICSVLAPEQDPGVLVDVFGDAGDTHRNGRSVRIAKFSSGLHVVYKPRSLAVDAHFQELLAWLNERGDHPSFRTLKVLDRGTHGWTEFIAAESCGSRQEVRRFYERQGAYVALLYALEATDFHYENLIAAGEHPMLLDLEALFHPRMGELEPRQGEQVAGSTMSYSVLRVGLLPQRSWSDGESAGIDLSGLVSSPGQFTPRPVATWEDAGTDTMRIARKRVEMPAGQNRPALHGAEVDVLEYVDAIEAGFSALYGCLLTHRDDLLSDRGPLARFAADEVRVILRPTYTYGLLQTESFHPDVLRDALERDRLFDRLWSAVEYSPHLARVIRAERHDLENGDIPLFTTRPNSRDLWSSSNERIDDFFDEPGLAPVRRQIQQLSDRDCARQLWFTRASLTTLAKTGGTTPRVVHSLTEPTAAADRGRLLSAARGVGDRLEMLALRGEADISWVGVTLANLRDWTLAPLGLDLYDGLPGVALYLAYLGEITGEERYTVLAQGALATLRRLVENAPLSTIPIGGFGGWGGVIYALTHLGKLWDAPHLLAGAEAIAEKISALIGRDEQFDMIGGAAGCIGSLLALYRCAPSERTLAAAVRCGDHLLAHAQPGQRGLGWVSKLMGERPLTGFSHGAAGIAWALLELASTTGEEPYRATALAAMEYERSLFSRAERNWPDLREVEASSATDNGSTEFSTTWCHGAPGIGLGRLLCLRHVDDLQIGSEINVALETTLASGFGSNHCLCHGDLGNLELLLQASLTLGESRWEAEVGRRAAVILQSIDESGWVCGNPLRVESPGLMTGLAGIGYELLRLAEPARVPSVLALAPPNLESVEPHCDWVVAGSAR